MTEPQRPPQPAAGSGGPGRSDPGRSGPGGLGLGSGRLGERRNAIQLVASREIRQRLRGKAFWIFTAILAAAIIGAGVLAQVIGGDDDRTTYDVAVAGDDGGALRGALVATGDAFGVTVRVTAAAPGDLPSLVDADTDAGIDTAAGAVVYDGDAPGELAQVVGVAWARTQAEAAAAAAGLTPEQASAVLDPAPLEVRELRPDEDDDDVGRVVGTAAGVMLFLSINFLGGAVLNGVVEEKTTAVVEVLLARVRAHLLLAGKVAGIAVVGLLQFLVAVAAGLVALRLSGASVPSGVWVAVPSTVGWFLGGFALYATLFGLAGSFVSRQEDAQGAVMPVSTFFTIAYLLMFVLAASPGSAPARVLSVLPPFAPLLMPLRIATGSASVVEIVAAIVLLVAAVVLLIRLAGRVYAHTVLHRGVRLRWSEALRTRGD